MHILDQMNVKSQKLIESIYYGNYFYGICAIAIILETSTQLCLQLQGSVFYIMSAAATILFYNHSLVSTNPKTSHNPKILWYRKNHQSVILYQVICTIFLASCMAWIFIMYFREIKSLQITSIFLALIFPLTAILYYKPNFITRKPLRQIGWLKPFVIAFVWAGMANVYPILYSDMIHSEYTEFNLIHFLLFLKAFMYLSMVAILFDVKDYSIDSQSNLNTFIVKMGLRKTLFYVITPITCLGLLLFIAEGYFLKFSVLKMVLNVFPFILLLDIAKFFRKKRALLDYLVVIDGLLLVKAFFGSIAMLV